MFVDSAQTAHKGKVALLLKAEFGRAKTPVLNFFYVFQIFIKLLTAGKVSVYFIKIVEDQLSPFGETFITFGFCVLAGAVTFIQVTNKFSLIKYF